MNFSLCRNMVGFAELTTYNKSIQVPFGLYITDGILIGLEEGLHNWSGQT